MNGSSHVANVGHDLCGPAADASFLQKNKEAAVYMLANAILAVNVKGQSTWTAISHSQRVAGVKVE